jgi:hypothetical protein
LWLIYALTAILPMPICILINEFVHHSVLGFARGSKTLMDEPTSHSDRQRTTMQKFERMLSDCFITNSDQAVP